MSRRRRRRDKGRALGWIYGTVGAATIIAIAAAAIVMRFGARETDRATGCPKDRYDSVTVVLIDLTDPVNAVQAAALRNALLKIRNDVPRYGRLEIYPLNPTREKAIEPLFAGCSPGSGRDIDSSLYGNPELADRLWQKQFASKVDAVAADIRKLPTQDSSPLFEGLQSVAVTALGAPLAAPASDKRIIVISDMIHHTADLSMYQGAPAFERFKATQYYLRIKPMLRGANVDVLLIVRETRRNVQQPPLYRFWVEFAAASDGYLRNWEPLQ